MPVLVVCRLCPNLSHHLVLRCLLALFSPHRLRPYVPLPPYLIPTKLLHPRLLLRQSLRFVVAPFSRDLQPSRQQSSTLRLSNLHVQRPPQSRPTPYLRTFLLPRLPLSPRQLQ